MTTQTENVLCVYGEQGELQAIVKREEKSGHKLVYAVKESSVEHIASLIEGKTPTLNNEDEQ